MKEIRELEIITDITSFREINTVKQALDWSWALTEYAEKILEDEALTQKYQYLYTLLLELQELKKKKVKKPKPTTSETTLFIQFLATYREWMTTKFGIIPDHNGAKAKAMKDIVLYFLTLAENDNDKAHQTFEHLLNDWDKLNPFLRGQTDLTSINRYKQEIVTKLKNGNTTNNSNNRDQTASSFMENVLK